MSYFCKLFFSVFESKIGNKTEFHRNGLLATLGSNFQEGQN